VPDDWTELYRPQSLSDVVGNPKAVKELKDWALRWEEGVPERRAVVLIGPPGVGKTSAALALARDFGWGVVEMNASDHRNGEAIKRIAIRGATADTFTDRGEFLSAREGGKKLIILDEADNIFGREDKGGVPAIAELVRETRQPVVLIVNDFYALSRKSSVIKDRTLQVRFSKVQVPTVKATLRRVASDRGVNVPDRVLELIAKNSNGDLRAALRDLQAIALGNEEVREEQAVILDNRLTTRSMYELMAEVFHGTAPARARSMMMDIGEAPEHVALWIDENLPIAYRDPEDLARGFEVLSRADIFLGRVTSRHYFGFWSYATELMTYGIATAKQRHYHDYVRFQFPLYLMKMSRSRSQRELKAMVAATLGSAYHASKKGAEQEVLPYFRWLYQKNRDFRLAATVELGMSVEEAAFLLEQKVDSSAVRHLMQDIQKKEDGARPDDHALRTVKIEDTTEPPEDKKAEEPKKQSSLFEY
jgi:replication factor C large subunit